MPSVKNATALKVDLKTIEAEITHIRTLTINDLRPLWSKTFKKEVPQALTKDLIARMLIWHLQEKAFGGLDRATLKVLDGYAKGSSPNARSLRRLKPGTELVREYQGERYNVIVMSDGFAWRRHHLQEPYHHRQRDHWHQMERPEVLRTPYCRRRLTCDRDLCTALREPTRRICCRWRITMNPPKKIFRCAIYTRKSTDHNLDLEFNSLDAQREACEAYIKSQAHEGWRLIPDQYNDGAYSGASLERPALQTLLADIHANKVDIIVVYKVDRLTRSLADFVKLVDIFDARDVSFISVTQSFNTTSSMGRLTLNVLLSFAQFEREVIGERVRDKISASKRKGLWVGGPVPLGYQSRNKKLSVVPDEAETVWMIFQQYLEIGSVRKLAEDLDRRGVITKRRVLSTGRVLGGQAFGLGGLNHLIRNRFYIGEIAYRGEIHSGDHEPILERELFEAVQSHLTERAVGRRLKLRTSPALLMGRLYDDLGNRMTPSYSVKNRTRYRYYVCGARLQRKSAKTGKVARAPAPEVEMLVMNALKTHLEITPSDDPQDTPHDRDLIEQHIDKVIISGKAINIVLVIDDTSNQTDEDNDMRTLTVPWVQHVQTAIKGVTYQPSASPLLKPKTRDALLTPSLPSLRRATGSMRS